MRSVFFLPLFFLLAIQPARASWRISILGGANFAIPLDDQDAAYSAKRASIYGLTFERKLSRGLGLEIGGFYLIRKYGVPSAGTEVAVNSAAFFEAPLLFRFWIQRNLGLGLGGYIAKASGGVRSEMVRNGMSAIATTQYADASLRTLDYGAQVSLVLGYSLGSAVSFFADGRYNYGIANGTTLSGRKLNYTDLQILAGLRFGYW